MSDALTVDTAVSTEDVVAAAVLATQMSIIDVAVRHARRQGWCGEFDTIMGQLFPDGPPDGAKEFVDSDGRSCHGYDRDGYAENGYDRQGYDREGYTPNGMDRDGYNREGFDRHGYGRDGYNRDGWDRAGFDRNGVHTTGLRRDSDEWRARFRYDRYGYDREGFDRNGRNVRGLTREQVAEHADSLYVYEWVDRYGLATADGRDIDGYENRGQGRHAGHQPDYLLLQRLGNR